MKKDLLDKLEDKFTFTKKADMIWLLDENLTREQFEKKYYTYLEKRFKIMTDKIIKTMFQ